MIATDPRIVVGRQEDLGEAAAILLNLIEQEIKQYSLSFGHAKKPPWLLKIESYLKPSLVTQTFTCPHCKEKGVNIDPRSEVFVPLPRDKSLIYDSIWLHAINSFKEQDIERRCPTKNCESTIACQR